MMLARWDASDLTVIANNSIASHVMVYAECLHAKQELGHCPPDKLSNLVQRLKSAVASHQVEDLLRFDASQSKDRLPQQAYCMACGGVFQLPNRATCAK
jgi:hypothetical protein